MIRRALLAAFAIAAPAGAELVNRDLFEPGDGLLTYDDANHREWLNLEYSSQFGSPDSPGQIVPPPALSDFTLATLGDVEALMASASVAQVEPWSVWSGNSPAPDFIGLFGETGRFSWHMGWHEVFTGGYIANDPGAAPSANDTVAVLAHNLVTRNDPAVVNAPVDLVLSGSYFERPCRTIPEIAA